jgi:hypothetical protein
MVMPLSTRTLTHVIDGAEAPGTSEGTFLSLDPHDGSVASVAPHATVENPARAVAGPPLAHAKREYDPRTPASRVAFAEPWVVKRNRAASPPGLNRRSGRPLSHPSSERDRSAALIC